MSQEAPPVRENVRGSIANDELENIKTELTCKLSNFLDTAIANINSNEYLKEHPSDLLRSFEEIIGNELGKLDTAMQKQTAELPTIEGDGYADGQLFMIPGIVQPVIVHTKLTLTNTNTVQTADKKLTVVTLINCKKVADIILLYGGQYVTLCNW